MDILDIVHFLKWIFKHANIVILFVLLANGIVLPIVFRPWGLIFGVINLAFFVLGAARIIAPDKKES